MAAQPSCSARAIEQPFGSVVVVGPTGSGKTTTLYGCLQHLNTPDRTLMTIEDPVEYRAEGPRSDRGQPARRADVRERPADDPPLRPRLILVGEIRDEETAQIAFRAAMTGHLVLTTLHAQTAAAAIQRLLDIDVDPGLISTSINCFVAQRLARRLCKDCAEPYQADARELATIGVPEEYGELQLFRAVGCPECDGIGYRGRVGLFEVMPMSDGISRLIGAPTREIEAEAVRSGMFTMRDDGIRLSMAG